MKLGEIFNYKFVNLELIWLRTQPNVNGNTKQVKKLTTQPHVSQKNIKENFDNFFTPFKNNNENIKLEEIFLNILFKFP